MTPKKPCSEPGCSALIELDQSRCQAHRYLAVRRRDRERHRVGHGLYKSKRWSSLRKWKLTKDPFCQCEDCVSAKGQRRLANVVDHHRPHNGDEALFFDPENLRSMFKPHHDRKTARDDGGFGNPVAAGR